MPRTIVINTVYGAFDLSHQVRTLYEAATTHTPKVEFWYIDENVVRDDPILIQIIRDIGVEAASGMSSKLKLVDIPDDVLADGWVVLNYDGMEWIAEKHRTWS